LIKKIIFKVLISGLLIIAFINGMGQNYDLMKVSIYKVSKKVEIPITIAIFMSNYVGFKYLNNKTELSFNEIMNLDEDNIWWFDRVATQQNADDRFRYQDVSDVIMNISIALPIFLMIDKDIRKDWLDLLVLYGETHAVNTSLYISSAAFIDRTRPFLYNPDVPYSDKSGTGTTISFFSGHVSTAATASFFMAKVYSDYHPELGNKKFWLFGAAIIPPALVGLYRVKAMKHFPTDVIVGSVIGAAIGIIIPQLHKVKKKTNLSFIPYTGDISGLKIQYTFR